MLTAKEAEAMMMISQVLSTTAERTVALRRPGRQDKQAES
jgi:hypothetical protein